MSWQPHVTVATIVEDQGKFLFVEEESEGRIVFNQPAGHLDPDETLQEAAVRETLEETGWEVELTGYLGVALYTAPSNGITYVRHAFAARPIKQVEGYQLDHGIVGPRWFTRDELLAHRSAWRSEMVLRTVDHYLNNEALPLSAIFS